MPMTLVALKKKQLSCLRCATDAAHRMCRKCRRHNSEVYDVPTYGSGGVQGDGAS